MNRLVLIGNGFDLAHGLKTSYADFINWYKGYWIVQLRNEHSNISRDSLLSIEITEAKKLATHIISNTKPLMWQ